jgi:hypothetical protein
MSTLREILVSKLLAGELLVVTRAHMRILRPLSRTDDRAWEESQ